MHFDSGLHVLTQEQACTGVGVPALNTIANNVETAIQNRLPALGFMRLQLYRKVL